mmetsp:Transcript_38004/g.88421  ORF Transcript_38004/g.88421 Transcript_38004/m.88421 type:complete len:96 (+) Transcript_38004:248-535(+)
MAKSNRGAKNKSSDHNVCFVLTRQDGRVSYKCKNKNFTLLIEKKMQLFKTIRSTLSKDGLEKIITSLMYSLISGYLKLMIPNVLKASFSGNFVFL